MNSRARSALFALVLLAAAIPCARASISLTLEGGYLKDRGTARVSYNSGLLLLVANTNNSAFTTPSTGFTLQLNQPVSSGSYDILLGMTAITGDPFHNNTPGAFDQPFTIATGSYGGLTVAPGDSLIMYWFPGVSSTATSLPAGADYGAYRSTVTSGTDTAGSDPWYLPADPTNGYTLIFATSDSLQPTQNTGTSGTGYGQAVFSVVPEPGSNGGAGVLGGARRVAVAPPSGYGATLIVNGA